jgi:quercetin dioxygenase-like cupin family protein
MRTKLLPVVLGCGLAALGGIAAAAKDKADRGPVVKELAARDIAEKLDGKETRATAVEVTLEPGAVEVSHRHPGPAFGYVIEGEYELGIDGQPPIVVKAGQTFYEPTGCLHGVGRNPGKVKTRFVAWVIAPRDAKELVIPEQKK